jgi:thioredoxin-related protein
LEFSDYAVYNDIENGLKVAALAEKNVLLIITRPACSSCKSLKAQVLTNPEFYSMVRKNCIVLVAEAEKDYYTRYPFEIFLNPEITEYETLNYFDLSVKKLRISSVPRAFLLNKQFEIVGSVERYSDYASYYSSLEGILALIDSVPTRTLKAISEKEESLLTKTLPNVQTMKFPDFVQNIYMTDPYGYYILIDTTVQEVQKFTESYPVVPLNLFIREK